MQNFVSDMARDNTRKEEMYFSKNNPAFQCSDVHKVVCREHKEYNPSDRNSASNDKCHAFGHKIDINIYISCCNEEEEEEE